MKNVKTLRSCELTYGHGNKFYAEVYHGMFKEGISVFRLGILDLLRVLWNRKIYISQLTGDKINILKCSSKKIMPKEIENHHPFECPKCKRPFAVEKRGEYQVSCPDCNLTFDITI